MHVRPFCLISVALLFLLLLASMPAPASDPPPRTGWTELSAVAPATPVVVELSDGRRLERHVVGTTADELVVLDLAGVSSGDRRREVLDQLRASPLDYFKPVVVEDGDRRMQVVERFRRDAIRRVSRPVSLAFGPIGRTLVTFVNWSGPCPGCDAAQTWAGRKDTVVPALLPAAQREAAPIGEVVYLAPAASPNPLDQLAWEQLRPLLPGGLRGK